MKAMVALCLMLTGLSQSARADHDSLADYARDLTEHSTNLQASAQRTLGYYSVTYDWQRHAYEHVEKLHDAAHEFLQMVESYDGNNPNDVRMVIEAYNHLAEHYNEVRTIFPQLFVAGWYYPEAGYSQEQLVNCGNAILGAYRRLPVLR